MVERLLHERLAVVGICRAGMPVGSLGMEVPGSQAERHEVLTFVRTGKTAVFAKR